MGGKVIPASAPSFAGVALLDILSDLFILVKGKPSAESVQLRCHRIKLWQRIDRSELASGFVCVWRGKGSSTRLMP